jgi:hypothetical protein
MQLSENMQSLFHSVALMLIWLKSGARESDKIGQLHGPSSAGAAAKCALHILCVLRAIKISAHPQHHQRRRRRQRQHVRRENSHQLCAAGVGFIHKGRREIRGDERARVRSSEKLL